MEDTEIIDLYWQRDQRAIDETHGKYGGFLPKITRKLYCDYVSAFARIFRKNFPRLVGRSIVYKNQFAFNPIFA